MKLYIIGGKLETLEMQNRRIKLLEFINITCYIIINVYKC